MLSCCIAIEFSWLYTKDFEKFKISALEANHNNYDSYMELVPGHSDFKWWKSKIMIASKNIDHQPFIFEIFTDASLTEWGAVCADRKVHGFWTEKERENNINFLELMAAYFGLKCLAKDARDCSILMRIDNTTAICYINRMGGTQFNYLNNITRDIWYWCEERNIIIVASYVSSKDNAEADTESRRLEPETEFELADYAFEMVVQRFGAPEIDLFASRLNHKCKRYVSWRKDPESEAVDAFTLSWKHFFFYAFLPFSIILRVLRKIKKDGAEGILVVPDWPCQSWYPLFRSLQCLDPVILSPNQKLLISCSNEPHPLWRSLSLVAARLSARRS